MNKKNFLFFLLINNFYTAQEKIIDGIVANINNIPILYSDIQNIINTLKYNKSKDNTGKKREIDIFNELIEQTLVVSTNPGISLDKEEKMIKKSITEQAHYIFDRYFHNNEKQFIEELGCNLEDYIKIGIENQKKQMLYIKIIQDLIKKKNFSPQEVENFYEYLKKQGKLPQIEESFEIYDIQLSYKESKNILEKAKIIREKLNNEKWENILKSLSKDRNTNSSIDQEWHTIGDLEEKFEYEVFKLKIGEISKVIKINDGYYIIKLLDLNKTKYKTAIIFFFNNAYSANEKEAFEDLNKIKENILSKKLSWEEAVLKYSQKKEETINEGTSTKKDISLFKKKDLSREIRNILKNTKEGEISDPFIEYCNNNKIYKIIFLKRHTKKHPGNLREDFNLFENLLRETYNNIQKKEIIKNLYKKSNIKLNERYKVCKEWLKKKTNSAQSNND